MPICLARINGIRKYIVMFYQKMGKRSRDKIQQPSVEACKELLEGFEKVQNPEEVKQTVELLIEQLFLLKAEIGCPFDRQFFIDAAKERRNVASVDEKGQSKGKAFRQLCLNFFRAMAAKARKEEFMRYSIPRILKMIRLEASLIGIASEQNKEEGRAGPALPVHLLELLIGVVLYAEEYDEEIVDELISDHLLVSPEWTYSSYIALEQMKKSFDASQRVIYRDPEMPETEFIRRFITFLLKMPKPLNPRKGPRYAAQKASKPAGPGGTDQADSDDVDSDSSIEYSEDESEEEESEEATSEEGVETESEEEMQENGPDRLYDYSKVFSSLWQETIFGKMPPSGESLFKVLSHMPSNVLPYAYNPSVYVNWLMKHLNGDEPILSMLSLRNLFELILRHGLGEIEGIRLDNEEKPSISAFYDRLYGHLNEGVVSSEYGKEFLELINTALQSTMLPSQLVAQFIKRLVRTACFTGSVESTTLLTIAINLLKKHNQTCLKMVHSENLLEEKVGSADEEAIRAEDDVDSSDHDKKRMYLWELPLLMNHFNERTAKVASTFYSDLRKKRCIMLKAEDVIGCDVREHLLQELTRAKREDHSTFRKTLQKTTDLTTRIFL